MSKRTAKDKAKPTKGKATTPKAEGLPPPELWTLQAAGSAMHCSLPIVYARIRAGEILAYRVGGRIMLEPQSVRDFMRRAPISPGALALPDIGGKRHQAAA